MLTVVIAIHIAAGLTAVIAGLTAMLAPKRVGRHPRSGHVFLVAVGVVFATALGIVAARPHTAYLLIPGSITLLAAATGFAARRIRWRGWLRHHIAAMGIAYIALLTTFYVDNGPKLPLWNLLPRTSFWILPAAIGIPLITRALLRHSTPTTAQKQGLHMTDHTPAADSILDQVRAQYAAAALAVTNKKTGACCGTTSTIGSDNHPNASVIAPNESGLGASQYDTTDLDQLPVDAVLASLGCGNPTAVAELHEGQTVLDLGSGGGIDVLLSARRVGPTGRAYGLDMTDEMLNLARANAADAGATNVEFVKGHMEAIPLLDASIDVVISNCVVNLSPDKPAVFGEIYRVLTPGGRIGISDLVADDHLTTEDRARLGTHADCIAGALTTAEYTSELADAGFTEITLTRSHTVTEGLHSTIIRATKPH